MRVTGLAVFGLVVAAPGRPTGCNTPDEVTVTWEVPDGPGSYGVERLGCLDWEIEVTRSSGCMDGGDGLVQTATREFATIAPGWTQCALRGWRQDGALRVEGPVIPLRARAQGEWLDLGLPDGPIAGMGAQIRSLGGAVRVERIVPGGPAEQAGIGVGAMVLAVDGVSTAGMSSPDFVRVSTGQPGTPVTYQVKHPDGGEDLIRLHRQRIPADWETRGLGGW